MTRYRVSVIVESFQDAQTCLAAFSDYKVVVEPLEDTANKHAPLPHPDKPPRRKIFRGHSRNGKTVPETILNVLADGKEHSRIELTDALMKAGYAASSCSPSITELRRAEKIKEVSYHVYALGHD
jgi:hypothetical protein